MRYIGSALLTAALCCSLSACADNADAPRSLSQADPAQGLKLIERHGCAACHVIPNIPWPQGRTGGSLDGIGGRPMIAGRLPNQPDMMTRFVRDAPSLLPDTGMPAMPLTEAEARDVAAYLYSLDED
jgi:sulfur-oxidizing protein SoxX